MRVYFEMAVVGEIDKLIQYAKLDKNVMGAQLLSLLTNNDFASEKGRNALRKNAFALIRMHRYRHAAAVFLTAEPPMLKEACNVINSYMNDPMLALFVARVVESRLGIAFRISALRELALRYDGDGTIERTGDFEGIKVEKGIIQDGYVLGPESRRVAIKYMMPALKNFISRESCDDFKPIQLIYSGVHAMLISLWLQVYQLSNLSYKQLTRRL